MLYYKTIPTTHVAGMAQTQTQNKTRQNYYATVTGGVLTKLLQNIHIARQPIPATCIM